jgi:peptidoglycan/xylan/chitin deacetylase (PgdA/CDA1 family)
VDPVYSGFDGTDADEHGKELVLHVELGVGEILAGEAGQEPDGREDVAVRLHLDSTVAEDSSPESPAGRGREAPVVGVNARVPVDFAHRRHGGQESSTTPQEPVCFSDRCVDVVDELERLRTDEAVEGIGRNTAGRGEVGDDGCSRIRLVDVDHIGAGDAGTKLLCVTGILYFEDTPADVGAVVVEEALDVVAVDRRAAVGAPVITQRRGAPQHAEPRPASRGELSSQRPRRVPHILRTIPGPMRRTVADIARRALGPRSPGDAVVLMYHRIAPPGSAGGGVTVSAARFEEHLLAARAHFRPLHLADLVQALTARVVPPRSVVFTFDDGYVDNLVEAKPLLERQDVPATVFVVSGYVGSRRRFWWDELERICLSPPVLPDRLDLEIAGEVRTWGITAEAERRALYRDLREAFGQLDEQERDELLVELRVWGGVGQPGRIETPTADDLRQLADGGLVEIGAHTVTHPRLTALPRERQLEEIHGSRRQLEELLDREIRLFSYPFGAHDRTTVGCAREAGLACACTTRAGGVRPSTDPYRLPRLYVGDWPADELVERVSAWLI